MSAMASIKFAAILMVVCVGTCGATTAADEALDACGMPRGYRPTSHCFNDYTHHVCCMLGPEARRYADASGNPIGTAASKAFYNKHGRVPDDSNIIPWCTCFGSLVPVMVSKSETLNSTTPVSDPAVGAFNIPAEKNCEAKAREYFKVHPHATPGVKDPHGTPGKCPSYDVQDNLKYLSDVKPETVGAPSSAPSPMDEL